MKEAANLKIDSVAAFDAECTCNNERLIDMAEIALVRAGPDLKITEEFDYIMDAVVCEDNYSGLTVDDVRDKPDYSFYYDNVKSFFELKNTVFLAHNPVQDIRYIAHKHMKRDYPLLAMKVYDTQKIVEKWGKVKKTNLEEICKELGIEHTPHRGNSDARVLIEIMKRICKEEKTAFSEVLEKYGKDAAVDSVKVYSTDEFREYFETHNGCRHKRKSSAFSHYPLYP